MEDIDELKHSTIGEPKYRLSNANVYVSSGGFHFTKHLDAISDYNPEVPDTVPSAEEVKYIEKALQSNADRFENHFLAVTGKLLLWQ